MHGIFQRVRKYRFELNIDVGGVFGKTAKQCQSYAP